MVSIGTEKLFESFSNFRVNLRVKDGNKDSTTVITFNSLLMTVNDLKRKIEIDHKIPIDKQKLLLNDKEVEWGDKLLGDFTVNDAVNAVVFNTSLPKQTINKSTLNHHALHLDSESDDETQNERVGNVAGAVGGNPSDSSSKQEVIAKKAPTFNKIEEDGWECPLCTLINLPDRPGCNACSTARPTSYKVPPHFKDIEYKLKVNEDLQTFFGMDKVEIRPASQKKNDLNRHSVRKSSDIFNILGEEKAPKVKATQDIKVIEAAPAPVVSSPNITGHKYHAVELFKHIQRKEAETLHIVVSSPNITRNKYRGVDNFNPYLFPKTTNVSKPVITSVIYKSSPIKAKDASQNHYQELVNLDFSKIAPNMEAFQCSICFNEIAVKAGAVLRECLHSFCKPCLASHIKYCDDPEVKCPFIDDQFSCQSLLQEREIRALVTKDEYDKHLSKSIRQAEHKMENTFHCKTPNCRGFCVFEEISNIFRCPVCTIVNCLTCGVDKN